MRMPLCRQSDMDSSCCPRYWHCSFRIVFQSDGQDLQDRKVKQQKDKPSCMKLDWEMKKLNTLGYVEAPCYNGRAFICQQRLTPWNTTWIIKLRKHEKGIPRITPWWGGFPGFLFCYSVNSTIRWKMQGWGSTTIVRWWQTVEQFSWLGRVIMPLGGDRKNKSQVEIFF